MPDMQTDTDVVRALEALRRSGRLPARSQARVEDISRTLVLANREPGRIDYAAVIDRARAFVELAAELGIL